MESLDHHDKLDTLANLTILMLSVPPAGVEPTILTGTRFQSVRVCHFATEGILRNKALQTLKTSLER